MISANTCRPASDTASSTTSAATAIATGKANPRRSFASVTRRHAMIGPIPDSTTSSSAIGTTNRRNAGGPTDDCVPVIASEMSGKNVSQKITAVIATSTMFWSRNTASRESSESSAASERSDSRREITR